MIRPKGARTTEPPITGDSRTTPNHSEPPRRDELKVKPSTRLWLAETRTRTCTGDRQPGGGRGLCCSHWLAGTPFTLEETAA
jgi:hypothetical protein